MRFPVLAVIATLLFSAVALAAPTSATVSADCVTACGATITFTGTGLSGQRWVYVYATQDPNEDVCCFPSSDQVETNAAGSFSHTETLTSGVWYVHFMTYKGQGQKIYEVTVVTVSVA